MKLYSSNCGYFTRTQKRTEIKLIYQVKKWMLKTAHVYIKIKLIKAIEIRQLFRTAH